MTSPKRDGVVPTIISSGNYPQTKLHFYPQACLKNEPILEKQSKSSKR